MISKIMTSEHIRIVGYASIRTYFNFAKFIIFTFSYPRKITNLDSKEYEYLPGL